VPPEVASDARFCDGCGQPVPMACPNCRKGNAPDARFCKACGRLLAASGIPAAQPRELLALGSDGEAERPALSQVVPPGEGRRLFTPA